MSSEEPIYDFWCPSYSYRRDKDYTICQMCLPAGNRFLDDGFEFCDRPPTNVNVVVVREENVVKLLYLLCSFRFCS